MKKPAGPTAEHERRFKELSCDPFILSVLRVTYSALADGMPQGDLRDMHDLAMKVVTRLDEQKCLRNYVPPKQPKTEAMF